MRHSIVDKLAASPVEGALLKQPAPTLMTQIRGGEREYDEQAARAMVELNFGSTVDIAVFLPTVTVMPFTSRPIDGGVTRGSGMGELDRTLPKLARTVESAAKKLKKDPRIVLMDSMSGFADMFVLCYGRGWERELQAHFILVNKLYEEFQNVDVCIAVEAKIRQAFVEQVARDVSAGLPTTATFVIDLDTATGMAHRVHLRRQIALDAASARPAVAATPSSDGGLCADYLDGKCVAGLKCPLGLVHRSGDRNAINLLKAKNKPRSKRGDGKAGGDAAEG